MRYMTFSVVRLALVGVGAMNSPRYAPAGLFVQNGKHRIAIDGGRGAEPKGKIDAWLVTDLRGELIREIRVLARAKDLEPSVSSYVATGIKIVPYPVVHTSHPTYGYLLRAANKRIVWAPEFFEFPSWAVNVDLMFADAAGWDRPIRFARGTGGHAAALDVAREAQQHGVRRLVFAHIGRPTIRAIDSGKMPAFGEFGDDGNVYVFRRRRAAR
jgi:hypothetical protein